MSLYLKYRPQDFSNVVGQEHVITTIQNALRHDSLTHAYLFAGTRGTGKTSLARIIAKALNCTSLKDGVEPCNGCEVCTGITSGRLVDMIEIDAASNRGIDEIRELREKIQFAPTQAKRKIYIIDEVHMLTKEAFNALLKTLEEPPEHAYFILATTEAHKIPETIVSRCQQFNFKRITSGLIVERLKNIANEEKIEVETEALELIARIANGGLRDAIGMLEQMTIEGKIVYDQVAKSLGLSGMVLIDGFFQALMAKDAAKAIEIINQVNAQGQSLHQFISEFISFLREQMLLSLENPAGAKDIITLIDLFSQAKQQINQALIPQLPLEVAVIQACTANEAVPQKQEEPVKTKERIDAKVEAKKAEAPVKDISKDEKSGVTPELSLSEIKTNWNRIAESIDTPFIRMSFSDSEPTKFENGNLHLAFKSSTLKDKVESPANMNVVLKAFENVFKTTVNLHLEMKKLDLKPDSKESDKKSDDPSVIDMAKEVFGV